MAKYEPPLSDKIGVLPSLDTITVHVYSVRRVRPNGDKTVSIHISDSTFEDFERRMQARYGLTLLRVKYLSAKTIAVAQWEEYKRVAKTPDR